MDCGTSRVVRRDVVLDDVVGTRALDVDAIRAVAVDRVPDNPAPGDVEVVDAMVAITVGDVVGDERVVPAGVHVDAGVLVGVRHVADDEVPGCGDIDAVGVPLPLIGVVV